MKIATKLLSFCLALVFSLTTVMPSPAMAADDEANDGTLAIPQQVFLLSTISNGVSGIKVPEEELQAMLTEIVNIYLDKEEIQDYIGDWDLVWGPVVKPDYLSQKPDDNNEYFASQSMYVAKKDNLYVVAIAGTNGASNLDWLEDFMVKRQMPWTYGEVGELHPKIALGTWVGLYQLLEMESPDKKSLLDFLGEAVAQSNDDYVEIIFTGHSLGGALSPTLALYALDKKNEWAGGNNFNICVEPTAGPTPGNEDFSTYYGERLGNCTLRIWNEIDIVPHAWNEEMLDEIPNMYAPEIPSTMEVEKLVGIAKLLAKDRNYTQLMPEEDGLPGKVKQPLSSICKKSTFSDLAPSGPQTIVDVSRWAEEVENKLLRYPDRYAKLSNLLSSSKRSLKGWMELSEAPVGKGKFLPQVLYQHTDAYADFLDVEDPYCSLYDVIGEVMDEWGIQSLGE